MDCLRNLGMVTALYARAMRQRVYVCLSVCLSVCVCVGVCVCHRGYALAR